MSKKKSNSTKPKAKPTEAEPLFIRTIGTIDSPFHEYNLVIYAGKEYLLCTIDIDKINQGRAVMINVPKLNWGTKLIDGVMTEVLPEIFDFDVLDLSRCPICNAQGFTKTRLTDDGKVFCANCHLTLDDNWKEIVKLPYIGE